VEDFSLKREQPTVAQHRITAAEIREMASRQTAQEIRRDLLELAERYDRLAARIELRQA
jgi:hypothetical protein